MTVTLAIHGGPPVRLRPFTAWPQFDDAERIALQRVLEQGQWWRVGGSEVDELELELAAFHGAPSALAVTNGTHALELALDLSGVGPGDEVIVPAFTFISTSNAVQRLGAVPVPVDIDLETYCLDPAQLEPAWTPRTKAVIPVHMAGEMVDMDAIGGWCADRSVTLIQDAAHAPGAQWRGQRIGELSTLACLSFQNGKLMTAGEGGAVLLPDADRHDEAFARHSCGRPPYDLRYHHATPSSNYRMNEFSAAVLRCQLARLPEHNRRRAQMWPQLARRLEAIPGIVPQGHDDRCDSNPRYMAMFQLDADELGPVDRDAVVDALVAEGIPALVNYPPVYRTAAFWGGPTADGASAETYAERCPQSETVGGYGIWLQHRVLLGDAQDLDDVAEAVQKVVGRVTVAVGA